MHWQATAAERRVLLGPGQGGRAVLTYGRTGYERNEQPQAVRGGRALSEQTWNGRHRCTGDCVRSQSNSPTWPGGSPQKPQQNIRRGRMVAHSYRVKCRPGATCIASVVALPVSPGQDADRRVSHRTTSTRILPATSATASARRALAGSAPCFGDRRSRPALPGIRRGRQAAIQNRPAHK